MRRLKNPKDFEIFSPPNIVVGFAYYYIYIYLYIYVITIIKYYNKIYFYIKHIANIQFIKTIRTLFIILITTVLFFNVPIVKSIEIIDNTNRKNEIIRLSFKAITNNKERKQYIVN